jgi:pyruvate/2-oxoglutarate/acetoin dehydrogenase E1 component
MRSSGSRSRPGRRRTVNKTYIAQIIETINGVTASCGPVLLYGENIDTGSRIAGLARGLTVNPAGSILNVGNCELTHMGVGFGMMLDGGNAVVFMKQLDFLLLGIDQIVNTFNFLRSVHPVSALGSFTIYPIVCDQGYQGPQSSYNAPGELASLANVNVFCLNAVADVAAVIGDQFVAPGFRIICTSQRLFGAPALDLPLEARSPDHAIFKYRSGRDLTIACYNFSLRDGAEIAARLATEGIDSELFHVNYVPGMDAALLAQSCARTGALAVIDDSKSVAKFGDMLITELRAQQRDLAVLSLGRRGCDAPGIGVAEDRFIPDYSAALEFARRTRTEAIGPRR